MSNRITFQLTEFVDLHPDGSKASSSFGYRIYDDYDAKYSNWSEKSDLPKTPDEALTIMAKEYADFYDSVLMKGGFYFCDEWISIDADGNVKDGDEDDEGSDDDE